MLLPARLSKYYDQILTLTLTLTLIGRLSKYYDQILAATACLMRANGDGWVASIDPDEFLHAGQTQSHRQNTRSALNPAVIVAS